MRLIMLAGKGGTGKTTLAGATGAAAAARGARTLIISLDPAHSLSDAFDLDAGLMDSPGKPVKVSENLDIQEVNVNAAMDEYWDEVHSYLSILFNTVGLEEVVAEEVAILPGMEEISALLYINHYVQNNSYDALILDCAPTAESMRFVSLPTALEWYMSKLFKLERNILKIARPLAQRLTDLPLPGDEYFASIENLFTRIRGVDEILADPRRTTVRLVANPEKMVLRETQRAFMYFCLNSLAVETVFLNRVWPQADLGSFQPMLEKQKEYIALAETFFAPLPIQQVPQDRGEILGYQSLLALGEELYGQSDPLAVLYPHPPLRFVKKGEELKVLLHLPFAHKGEVDLAMTGDELVVRLGVQRRHIALPHSFAAARPTGAGFEDDYLVVNFASPPKEA